MGSTSKVESFLQGESWAWCGAEQLLGEECVCQGGGEETEGEEINGECGGVD